MKIEFEMLKAESLGTDKIQEITLEKERFSEELRQRSHRCTLAG